LAADVVEFSSAELPRFNPISVTGYHAREAGCDAVQELGLTMADAIAYASELVSRGLPFDQFAPRLSFHFATTLDLFEEVAKLRAARRLWHSIATERFGAKIPASARLRFFSGNSGTTLTAQQPYNNVVRSTIQCLGAVLGGAQSVHVMGFDEAYEIPTEEAVTLSLRTQQVIALETGVARTADPLGGSYYVESLTDEVERRAQEVIVELERAGGVVAALEAGTPQRWIAESAYRVEKEIAARSRLKVGVNVYADEGAGREPRLFHLDPRTGERQVERLEAHRASRAQGRVRRSLQVLAEEVAAGNNVMPPLLEATSAGATLGEMANVLRDQFGEFKEPWLW
jgi:methylmalonyl-CoA mutase N-terminal domain/subunit